MNKIKSILLGFLVLGGAVFVWGIVLLMLVFMGDSGKNAFLEIFYYGWFYGFPLLMVVILYKRTHPARNKNKDLGK